MARNEIVNNFANDVRRNVDKDSTGIRVTARNARKSGVKGKISIMGVDFRIHMYLNDNRDYTVSFKICDYSEFGIVRKRALNFMEEMGFNAHVIGNVIFADNIEANRKSISALAVRLAA